MIGDDLKKTSAGNLFAVFGELDIDVRALPNDEIDVEVLEPDPSSNDRYRSVTFAVNPASSARATILSFDVVGVVMLMFT